VWARPAHFGLRDRTLFQNGEKRFTLLQEDLQNSIAASQPASRGKSDKSQGTAREREREIARPTLDLVCEREGQVCHRTYLQETQVGHCFISFPHLQIPLVGPPRITLDCLHTLTSVAAKPKSKANGEEREAVHSKFLQVFWGRRGFLTPHNCSFPTHYKQTLQNSMACHKL
jgi:hypothetical protein